MMAPRSIKTEKDTISRMRGGHINWREVSFSKLLLLAVVGLVLGAIVFTLLGSSFRSLSMLAGHMSLHERYGEPVRHTSMDVPNAVPFVMDNEFIGSSPSSGKMVPDTSFRTSPSPPIAPPIHPKVEYAPGSDLEAYEIRSYQASFETMKVRNVCGAIESLKPRPDVVFMHASQGERHCSYSFKVLNEATSQILEFLAGLNPKEFTQNTQSVKRSLDEYMTAHDIMRADIAAVETVLAEAQKSYDELTALAVRRGDAEALAVAVSAKISLIDQLRQRREMTRQSLGALIKAKAELEDQMQYTHFSVLVYEFAYLDNEEAIFDSWKRAIVAFVGDANRTLQQLTLGLLTLVLYGIVLLAYGVLMLVAAKYAWRHGRRFWQS